MGFISLLAVLGLLQMWGSGGPFQRDAWFEWLSAKIETATMPAMAQLLLLTVLPASLLLIACVLISFYSSDIVLLAINIPVLLYALGRGRLANMVDDFKQAWEAQDHDKACQAMDALRVDGVASCNGPDQWEAMHEVSFRAISYRGFERIFAVLFWFAVLGAAGALLYRLIALTARSPEREEPLRALAMRLLWLLEWPAVRIYYLSVALAGNFVACVERWKILGFCVKSPTPVVVEAFNRGALGMDGSLVREVVGGDTQSLKELDQLMGLMSRALVLWVCAAAAIALFTGS